MNSTEEVVNIRLTPSPSSKVKVTSSNKDHVNAPEQLRVSKSTYDSFRQYSFKKATSGLQKGGVPSSPGSPNNTVKKSFPKLVPVANCDNDCATVASETSSGLNELQVQALQEMREKFADVYIPGKYVQSMKAFAVDDSCLLRYLRARNFDTTKASTMLQNTLTWRKTFIAHRSQPGWKDSIVHENSTGKMYTRGFDKEGHALLYLKPSQENTYNFEGNMQHLVFNLDESIRRMNEDGRGKEKIVLLVDYENWGLSNCPPLKTSKETLHILQNHYPERLHRAVAINPPWIFGVFWNAIAPFIDPVTKAKIVMLTFPPEVCREKLLDMIEGSVLESKYGGENIAPFESATYLKSIFDDLQ